MNQSITASVVQLTPVYLNPNATLAKILEAAEHAASAGASLVVFPELALAGYPNWINLNNPASAANDSHYFRHFVDAAIQSTFLAKRAIQEAATRLGCAIVVGLAEANDGNRGPVFDSALLAMPGESRASFHRKLCPVKHEKLFFARGGASDTLLLCTEPQRIGVGICSENWLTPYKLALGNQREEIHCALWVNLPRLKKAVDASAAAWSIELGAFNLVSCQVGQAKGPAYECEYSFIGGSQILAPDGTTLAGPVYDEESILTAVLDPALLTGASATFGGFGNDGREDLFPKTSPPGLHSPGMNSLPPESSAD